MKRALALGGTLLALVVLNIVLPRVTNPYYFQVLMLIGINIVLAVSLNLVNGFTGQFSIGHAGFMAVGAYTSAMFTLKIGQPLAASWHFLPGPVAEGLALLMALVAGGLLAAVAGWIVGLPSLRLRGDYLAIVTLGFGEIIRVLILNIDAIGAARGRACWWRSATTRSRPRRSAWTPRATRCWRSCWARSSPASPAGCSRTSSAT